MAVNLSPVGGVAAQFFDNSGNVLTGGKLYTYLAGTTTPAVTYTTSAGSVAWSNPIILDAAGRVSGSGEIWLTDSFAYKFVLKDSNDVLIATYDNIVGINSNFVNFTSQEETQTATQGQTLFTLTTMQYQPGVDNLLVFVNGSKQISGTNYVETSATEVTFLDGLNVGDVVDFTTAAPINTLTADAFSVSYTPPFVDSVATNVGDKLAQTISVMDFGAVGDGTTDDTAAIQTAIEATPINGKLVFPNATYKVTASTNGALAIFNSINIDFQGSTLLCDTDDASTHVIKISTTGGTNPASLGPFGVFAFVNLQNGIIRPTTLADNDTYDAANDPRNSAYNAIYMTEVDSIIINNMTIESVKGAALNFGNVSAVRESYFNNIYAVNCGNQDNEIGVFNITSPVATAFAGIHNHLYFNGCRATNSYWRSVQIMRGASVAAAFGTFLVEFNSCMFDNASETAAGSGTPAGPQCEMVLFEHCGYHMTFNQAVILNPYSSATTKWGYPAVRIGTSNYPNSTVEQTEFINCRINQGLNWGVGIQVERANKVGITQTSFAFEALDENRGIVVAKFNATDNYGTATDVDINPYINLDNSNDYAGGIYLVSQERNQTIFGALSDTTNTVRQFSPNGFSSGTTTGTVAANTTQTVNFSLGDLSLYPSNSSWLVSITVSNTGAVNVLNLSTVVTCVDANIIADVQSLGSAVSNGSVLTATVGRYGGLSAGVTSAGNGNKFALAVTNNSLTLAANISIYAIKIG